MVTVTAQRAAAGSSGSALPLAVAFANTLVAVRGKVRETLGTPDELAAWLAANTGAPEVAVGAPDLTAFRALRDAVRAVLRAYVDGEPAPAAEVERINEASAAAPRWPVLTPAGAGYAVTQRTDRDPLPAALAALAHGTADLLGGPLAADLRACHGPGCVQFFVKDHPRREWCGPGCGNRARAARHYHRQREQSA
ncbi:ABATE domain-containing protein [Kitasatospora aureofaciens]|uniref:CGNR zinc finger domain-containing protein n=1 Tax=Kitasatospora aureofaciens TaxID=1894 RepID=UPI001C45937F|nr:ABATE domain-containing protein [Kitasatospora aureofaciens]MBV6696937.1 ABATE domain-containing protein [Kitasatospora aureofaciens]